MKGKLNLRRAAGLPHVTGGKRFAFNRIEQITHHGPDQKANSLHEAQIDLLKPLALIACLC